MVRPKSLSEKGEFDPHNLPISDQCIDLDYHDVCLGNERSLTTSGLLSNSSGL